MATIKVREKAVLVVVQDLFFAVRIADTLRALGCKGVTVQNEDELRSKLSQMQPHLVILDLQARGVDAGAVCQAVRETDPGRTIPVLAYGPHVDVKSRDQAIKAGCHRVVAKSMLAAELPQLVRRLLG